MDPQTPPPSFWRDKRERWIARARTFNVATAFSAAAALNEHVSSAPGSLSHERVELVQGEDGLFKWTPSALSLLKEMNEDVRILDDIGRTSAAASPVKGIPPSSPPFFPFPLRCAAGIVRSPASVRGGDVCIARLGELPRRLPP